MFNDNTGYCTVGPDYARNAVINTLLEHLMALDSTPAALTRQLRDIIQRRSAPERLACYKKIRMGSGLSEQVRLFLISREIVCLAERELVAEIREPLLVSPLSVKDCGLGGLPHEHNCLRPPVGKNGCDTEADWKRRLEVEFQKHGEGGFADLFSREPTMFRDIYALGWRELYSRAYEVAPITAPAPWIARLVEKILVRIEVHRDTPTLAVHVGTADGNQLIRISPSAHLETPSNVCLMWVDINRLSEVVKHVTDIVWFTRELDADAAPGLLMIGGDEDESVQLEIFARHCPVEESSDVPEDTGEGLLD